MSRSANPAFSFDPVPLCASAAAGGSLAEPVFRNSLRFMYDLPSTALNRTVAQPRVSNGFKDKGAAGGPSQGNDLRSVKRKRSHPVCPIPATGDCVMLGLP